MTVEEFEDFLSEVVERVEDLDNNLVPLINQMVQELKNRAPVADVNGGRLRDSIKATIVDNAVTFSFNDYGLYQNFGVMPLAKTPFKRLKNPASQPFGVTPTNVDPIMGGSTYQYSNRKFGLPARQWFNFEEITTRIIAEIERLTIQNNQ